MGGAARGADSLGVAPRSAAAASHHATTTTLLPPRRLVLQCETSFSKTQWVWRAAIPQGPRPAKRAAAFGPHALLGVAPDASAEEAQRACSAHTAPPTHCAWPAP